MMSIEELNALKKEQLATYPSIAARAGIPVSTVQKVLGVAFLL